MLFIDNKYTKWYFGIIASARQHPLNGYTEKHHIIPRCMGGPDDSDNLVKLTARQHFICHLLLTKMVTDKMILSKLKYAAILLSKDYTIGSRIYEMMRRDIVQDDEWISRRTSQRIGKKHSAESIDKLIYAARNRHVIYVTCIICRITSNFGNYVKLHNGNCGVYRGPAWNSGVKTGARTPEQIGHMKNIQQERGKLLREQRDNEYLANPSFCKICNKIIPRRKRTHKYCGKLCRNIRKEDK